jgi:hypothetical protein
VTFEAVSRLDVLQTSAVEQEGEIRLLMLTIAVAYRRYQEFINAQGYAHWVSVRSFPHAMQTHHLDNR